MPSPIVHTSAGYLIYRLFRPQNSKVRRIFLLATTTMFSLLPDADVIPGLLFRNFGRYHQGITHSLIGGFILSLVVSSATERYRDITLACTFGITFISYELHVLMDYLSGGKRGVMFFWPFSKRRFRFPKKLFYGVKWNHGPTSRTHLWTVATEVALIIGSVLILRGFDLPPQN